MYRTQMDSMGYNRGSSNMLGLVLIFVVIAIGLTVLAVLGITDAFQDAARARQIDSQTAHQETLWAADEPNLALKAAAQAALDADNAHAAGIRAVADAQAYAASQAESISVAQARNDQRLARERLIGEATVYVTALTVAVIVLLMGFMAFRLIYRLLPRQERASLSRPVTLQPATPTVSQPRPRPAPQPGLLQPAMSAVADEGQRVRPNGADRRTITTATMNKPSSKRGYWTPRTH